jgi:O-antigen/teichoic acid export membrane protein
MRRVLMGVSWSTGARAVYMLAQWLQLAVVAHATDPATVGAYGLALAIAVPIYQFANSGLRVEFVTGRASSPARFVIYLVFRYVTVIASLLLTAAIALIFYPFELQFVIRGVSLVKAGESLADILHAWLQRQHRFDMIFMALAARGLSGLLAFVIVFGLGGNLALALTLQFISAFLCLLIVDLRYVIRVSGTPVGLWRRYLFPPKRRVRFGGARLAPRLGISDTLFRRRALFFHASWLGAAGFGAALVHNIPRYFVEARMGLDELGYFTALYYVIHAGSMLITSGTMTLLQPMSRMIANHQLRRLMMTIAGSIAVIAVGSAMGWIIFYFFGAELLGLIYGAEYAAYADVFLILLVGGFFRFVWLFLGQVIIAWRYFRLHFVGAALSVLITIIASWLMIGDDGFYSVCASVIASYVGATGLYVLMLVLLAGTLLRGRMATAL